MYMPKTDWEASNEQKLIERIFAHHLTMRHLVLCSEKGSISK